MIDACTYYNQPTRTFPNKAQSFSKISITNGKNKRMIGAATQTKAEDKQIQLFCPLKEKKAFNSITVNCTKEITENPKKSPKKKYLYLTLLPHREFQKLIGIPKEEASKHILGNLKYSRPTLYNQNSSRGQMSYEAKRTMLR